jgi:hypothetical protein
MLLQRFTHLHVDLVGPLPVYQEGFAYLLTIVDRTTRWLEAIPLRATAAAYVAAMKLLGIKHQMSTAFHPQSNGLVEQAHRRLKEALKAKLAGGNWPSHLPWVLLGLRTAPWEDSGLSMTELVYGTSLNLPGSMVTAAKPPPELFGQRFHASQLGSPWRHNLRRRHQNRCWRLVSSMCGHHRRRQRSARPTGGRIRWCGQVINILC